MKNLFLIRHAKSCWDFPLNDIDRPLTTGGAKDAHLVSTNILKHIPNSFIIWSSTAKRAIDTSLIFAHNLFYPIESILYKKELYTFDIYNLENTIKNCSDNYDNLIVFGHNEAITNFVNKFGSTSIGNVPTSGFVQISFNNNSWQDIQRGNTQKVIFPRDLKSL